MKKRGGLTGGRWKGEGVEVLAAIFFVVATEEGCFNIISAVVDKRKKRRKWVGGGGKGGKIVQNVISVRREYPIVSIPSCEQRGKERKKGVLKGEGERKEDAIEAPKEAIRKHRGDRRLIPFLPVKTK